MADPRLPKIYAVARKLRKDLDGKNADASERMYEAWREVVRDLKPRIDAITARIEEARDNGETVNPAWLYQQERYRQLIKEARTQFEDYARTVYNETRGLQQEAADRAIDQAYDLVRGAFGSAYEDRTNRPTVLIRPGVAEMQSLVGFLGDGSPLNELLATFGTQASSAISRALLVGITTGQGTREIARAISRATNIPRIRAETIARTELHRTFREATRRTFEANKDVVTGWIWHAAQQRRTCAACWALHGTFHPVTEQLNGHVRCRCAMLPQTKTWEELGIKGVEDERITVPLGSDLFDKLTAADQRYILGPSKYALFAADKITLPDLATLKKDARWGNSWQESTIAQALKNAEAREKAAQKASRPPRAPRKPKAPPGQSPADPTPSFKPGAQVRSEIEAYAEPFRDEIDLRASELRRAEARALAASKAIPYDRAEHRLAYNEYDAALKAHKAVADPVREHILDTWLYQTDRAQVKTTGAPRKPSDRATDEQRHRYRSWTRGYEAWTRLVGTGHLDGRTITYNRINKRSHYSNEGIYIDSKEHGLSGRVIVHEMGHWLEDMSPGFHQEIYAHYQRRTAGETAQKLKDLFPDHNYRDNETTLRDKWIAAYSGKDYAVYGLRNSEIVSMTLEQLYEDPLDMITQDPETFDLVWRLLRSKNVPRTTGRRTSI